MTRCHTDRYNKLKLKGLCVYCGSRKSQKNYIACKNCRKKVKDRNKEKIKKPIWKKQVIKNEQ